MIPDHLIDKAVRAAGENWVLTFEWEHDKLHAQVHAAIEAVAADIFRHGYNLGKTDGLLDRNGIDAPTTPNPYQKDEDEPPQRLSTPPRHQTSGPSRRPR